MADEIPMRRLSDFWAADATLLPQQAQQGSPRRAKRSGVLAGKLAAGVDNLLASNPRAPVELQQLAGKSVANLLASYPTAADDLQQLAGKSFLLAGKLDPQLTGKLRSTSGIKELHGKLSSKGGLARAANISPERRREIAQLGVEAKRRKKDLT